MDCGICADLMQFFEGWELWPVLNTCFLTILTACLTWLGSWVVPRLRKLRDRADIAQVEAETAKATAEAAASRAESIEKSFEFYHNALDRAEKSIVLLRDQYRKLDRQHEEERAAREELETKYERQNERMRLLEVHVDDLYHSIALEDDPTQTRIKSRLHTHRPNGERMVREAMEHTDDGREVSE